ncbi:MAG: YraN family protein [Cyanobacteria bacterium HKST-UBA06]|nr:YraN family protein [Cyanobacteria bacterium HKST-UBA05]MCA9799352.1 YraN family protein [Cyanobacteria bacterium HKST-UBA04]MCA9806505.1 YraN family protein [Cyanobacteria bacterium HKST-UBA06]MCA9841327.1 YraN family protein [Cyanobacteria bacterium HKST-UBA03]
MTRNRQWLGRYGETVALRYVQSERGFTILDTNWRDGRRGELDIVAFDDNRLRLRFIEVKTRRTTQFGHPAEAVNTSKQDTIRHLAQAYITQRQGILPQYRDVSFDIISIQLDAQHTHQIEYLESAF